MAPIKTSNPNDPIIPFTARLVLGEEIDYDKLDSGLSPEECVKENVVTLRGFYRSSIMATNEALDIFTSLLSDNTKNEVEKGDVILFDAVGRTLESISADSKFMMRLLTNYHRDAALRASYHKFFKRIFGKDYEKVFAEIGTLDFYQAFSLLAQLPSGRKQEEPQSEAKTEEPFPPPLQIEEFDVATIKIDHSTGTASLSPIGTECLTLSSEQEALDKFTEMQNTGEYAFLEHQDNCIYYVTALEGHVMEPINLSEVGIAEIDREAAKKEALEELQRSQQAEWKLNLQKAIEEKGLSVSQVDEVIAELDKETAIKRTLEELQRS